MSLSNLFLLSFRQFWFYIWVVIVWYGTLLEILLLSMRLCMKLTFCTVIKLSFPKIMLTSNYVFSIRLLRILRKTLARPSVFDERSHHWEGGGTSSLPPPQTPPPRPPPPPPPIILQLQRGPAFSGFQVKLRLLIVHIA